MLDSNTAPEQTTRPAQRHAHGQRRGHHRQPGRGDAAPSESPSALADRPDAGEPAAGAGGHEDDSWNSHLWFGLAALALAAPFLIPGLPRRALFVTYLAAGCVLMIAPIAWGLIRSTREAWRVRRARPRRGLWSGRQ